VERSVTRSATGVPLAPDFASLHPGYRLSP
jgi:hypothetical protein